jgi:hypothetical protein
MWILLRLHDVVRKLFVVKLLLLRHLRWGEMLELMREIVEPHVHVHAHAHAHVRLQLGVAAGLQRHWSWFHYYLWREMMQLHVRVLAHHVP